MAIVKRKTPNGTWANFDETPIDVPISINQYVPALPNVISAGETPIIYNSKMVQFDSSYVSSAQYKSTGISVTLPKAGTYRIKSGGAEGDNHNNVFIRLYHDNNAIGQEHTLNSSSHSFSEDITAPSDGYEITLWMKPYISWSWPYGACGGLCACISWPEVEEKIQ